MQSWKEHGNSRHDGTRFGPTVFIVAGFPPPPGGIAIHAHRLCNLLVGRGYKVFAYETNRRNQSVVGRKYVYYSESRPLIALRLVKDVFAKRPSLVHLHVSALSNALPLLVGIPLLALRAPLLLTVHSGSFPARVARLGPLAKSFLRKSVGTASRVVATSELIRVALVEECQLREEKVVVIPAFIKPEEGTTACGRSEPGVFLASGYGTPTYFWEGLLEASRPLREIHELVLAFYTRYDSPYFETILEKTRVQYPFKVTVHQDLANEAFLRELSRCSVFVRPTLIDGDSVALREALALGKTVVASDAAPRPPGCLLFRSGDPADLRAKLLLATGRSIQSKVDVEDFSEPLLRVYGEAMRRFSRASRRKCG